MKIRPPGLFTIRYQKTANSKAIEEDIFLRRFTYETPYEYAVKILGAAIVRKITNHNGEELDLDKCKELMGPVEPED